MCRLLIGVLFLAVQGAVVFGTMTIDDLPQETVNCLDNVLIPAARLRYSAATENCKNFQGDENFQCKRKFRLERNDEIFNCDDKIHELPATQSKFANAYLTIEEIKLNNYDFSSQLPESMRDCVNDAKPLMLSTYEIAKECEKVDVPFSIPCSRRVDNCQTQSPYEECMNKVDENLMNPQFLKCFEMARELTDDQMFLLKIYLYKTFFDLVNSP